MTSSYSQFEEPRKIAFRISYSYVEIQIFKLEKRGYVYLIVLYFVRPDKTSLQ